MGKEFVPGDTSMSKVEMACHLCSALIEELSICKLIIIMYNERASVVGLAFLTTHN